MHPTALTDRHLLQQLRQQAIPLLGRVPFPIQKALVCRGIQMLFGTSARTGELDFLDGRYLAIEITDAGIRWPLSLQSRRIIIGTPTHPADACIRGQLATYIALANRREDPDTLFFQRRLSMQGDTELGLYLKNWLDTLDPGAFPAPIRHLLSLAERTFPPHIGPTGR